MINDHKKFIIVTLLLLVAALSLVVVVWMVLQDVLNTPRNISEGEVLKTIVDTTE